MDTTCCFTGHRPAKLPWGSNEKDPRCRKVKEELAARLEGMYLAGYRKFICGMAEGCDLYFAEAVLAMRKQHPDVTLEAAVPCDGQADRWPASQQRRYERLLAECDVVTFVQHRYSAGCMMRRNRYMVDHSSAMLACYNGQSGGTLNTILYAESRGLIVIWIEM